MNLPIVPEDGLFLSLCESADAGRFTRLFAEVWRAIPTDDREMMLRHWRPAREAFGTDPYVPKIEVLDRHSKWFRGGTRNAVAQCDYYGCSLTFWSAWIEALPDEHAKHLIAHELGHVFCGHLGSYHVINDQFWLKDAWEPPHPLSDRDLHPMFGLKEKQANQKATEWGFDREAYEEWIDLNPELLPEPQTVKAIRGLSLSSYRIVEEEDCEFRDYDPEELAAAVAKAAHAERDTFPVVLGHHPQTGLIYYASSGGADGEEHATIRGRVESDDEDEGGGQFICEAAYPPVADPAEQTRAFVFFHDCEMDYLGSFEEIVRDETGCPVNR